MRALNLAAALVAGGRVAGHTVVGAGPQGLRVQRLRHLGAKAVVLETQGQVLSLFRGDSTRWCPPSPCGVSCTRRLLARRLA